MHGRYREVILILGESVKIIGKFPDNSLDRANLIPKAKLIFSMLYNYSGFHTIENIIRNRTNQYIIAVNYHAIQKTSEENFILQLKLFSKKYEAVDRDKLESFLHGVWPFKKPGIMLHFDDGLHEHYEIAAPLLDKFGFTGWFHVITDRLDNGALFSERPCNQTSMTWGQTRDLTNRGHEICSHTCTHRRLNKYLSDEEIEREVCHSFDRIKHELSTEPIGFCWPGGEIDAYDIRAMKLIISTYKYAFPSYTKRLKYGISPYAINRCNIETAWPISAVSLSMGFLWELKHAKRAEVYAESLSGIMHQHEYEKCIL